MKAALKHPRTHQKCLRSLGLMELRPPPIGAQAATSVTSEIFWKQERDLLKQKLLASQLCTSYLSMPQSWERHSSCALVYHILCFKLVSYSCVSFKDKQNVSKDICLYLATKCHKNLGGNQMIDLQHSKLTLTGLLYSYPGIEKMPLIN